MTETYEIGGQYHAATWLNDPSEIPAAQVQLSAVFIVDGERNGVRFGAATFEVVEPGDKRLPAPPWPAERALLATATVEKVRLPKRDPDEDADGDVIDTQELGGTYYPVRGFAGDLSERDKLRLMEAGKLAYREMNPGKPDPSVAQLIAWIEAVGPRVWEKHLKMFVDEGRFS
jgi:hypothetical protein